MVKSEEEAGLGLGPAGGGVLKEKAAFIICAIVLLSTQIIGHKFSPEIRA